MRNSRRTFLKTSALGLGAVGLSTTAFANTETLDLGVAAEIPGSTQPASEIAVWTTSGKQRLAAGKPISWHPAPPPLPDPPPGTEPPPPDSIRLITTNKFQDILGFGGCFSDAACYVIHQLKSPARDQLLHELFHPSELGLSVSRTCIGGADSAATLYSYDEGEPDPELKRFSIDHDREYILPILRQVREINPDVFYFSSPWSPPGWMKWNKSMLGGSMSRQYLASYAQYFLKFLQAYADAGVPVQAITTQNEIDTDQHGQMPACTWSQECETEFITDHLGPLFEKTNTATKIWILDHNFVYWGRVTSQLDDPEVRRYVNAIAWHAYTGEPGMASRVHAAHPEVEMHYTEGSTDYNDPHYEVDWAKWGTTYSAVLGNWCRSACAWNMCTDERGKPNIGPYPCGGILIVNPHTQEVTRSGQYWALAHFSKLIRRGARRFESQSQVANLSHFAAENPDGQKVLVITNPGPARTIHVNQGVSQATVALEENSLATLVWK